MGREERLIYTRVMRLQGRDRARVLRRPLEGEMVNNKNRTPCDGQGSGGQENLAEAGTYHFHAAVYGAGYELVFLEVGPVHAINLACVLVPCTNGESLDHLSRLLSPALRRGGGIGV